MWRFLVRIGQKVAIFNKKIEVAPKVGILGNFCGDLVKNHLATLFVK